MLVSRFFGCIAASSGDTIAARRHVFYPVSELAIFRQSIVGNDKALPASLSLAEKTSVEVYHEHTCLLKKNDKHMLVGLCRFFVSLLCKKEVD